ncbi:DNA processing protein [Dethiosulfatibacter aminovorans DSM 17477]|uniref:DNA processing protein n=1 Tax=Dethiosulfatibacter aminovorans DSM 17477 TaxID=1121476 RepID=A0A1M6MRV5_9FIRM|nr:DNA-processing protein DprA [Dethiosulfatibacter aminovorans]SHJ86184.1 DNA processing protein [Dethiosulfatibacter aminovorans DSM 17477]
MKYWIWLSRLKGTGPVLQKRLLKRFGSPEGVYEAAVDELIEVEGVGRGIADNIVASRSFEDSLRIIDSLDKLGGKILTIGDELYPMLGAGVEGAPVVFYYRGQIRKDLKGIGIVGSRRCSQYGKRVALEAGSILGQKGYAVISGMAKGIDGYAHIGCLKAGGYTIAFLGTGLDICYPREHGDLMEKIVENGAVISEYPPGTPGRAEYFPKRNYHISSWSKRLLVVEASERSGALITARNARDQGREVFAVPSNIYSATGRGTNRLIDEGARVYTGPGCLVDKCGQTDAGLLTEEKSTKRTVERDDLDELERKVMNAIGDKRFRIQEISEMLEIGQVELSGCLAEMELKGVLGCVSGVYGVV